VGLPGAINPDRVMPYSMQWNFTIEHTRWDTGFRASYIGTNTRQGNWSYTYNSPIPDDRPFVDKPRLFPNYPVFSYNTNGTGHQYHALTMEAERRMVKGLHYQFSWSWARDISVDSAENPYAQRERSVASDIPTHRVTANWIYQFPFGKGRKFLGNVNRLANLAIGGWELSGIYSYHSGQFLTPSWSGPDPTGTSYTTSRTPPNVSRRPDILRDPNLPRDERTVTRWFDTTAFAAPGIGRYGTSGIGVIKGPWVNVWHAGLYKNLEFTEKVRLRWELTATNVFNHPNWSNPNTTITSTAQVGVISGVGGVNGASTGDQPAQRSFRMGLRAEW
jgi:hypothetical protein